MSRKARRAVTLPTPCPGCSLQLTWPEAWRDCRFACQTLPRWVAPTTTSAMRRSATKSSVARAAMVVGTTYWEKFGPALPPLPSPSSSPAIARAAASQASTFTDFMSTLIIMPSSGSGAGRLTPMPPRSTVHGPRGWWLRW